jgi:hypothetical protein
MRPLRILFSLGVALALAPRARAEEKPVFHFPPGKHGGKAELKYINDVPVLIVSGTPEEMGAGVGALALKPGRRVVAYPRDLLKALAIDRTWAFFVGTGRGMFKLFPERYRQELEAMVKSAGVDRDGVIAGNTFFDIKKFLACSAVLVEGRLSTTGGPLLGRNLDYPSLGYVHQYSLVTVYRPAGKRAFATVGFPGLLGALSGMNDAGLSLAVLEVLDVKAPEPNFNARGTPYGLCLRTVLEECATIAEAKKKLEGMRRTTTACACARCWRSAPPSPRPRRSWRACGAPPPSTWPSPTRMAWRCWR